MQHTQGHVPVVSCANETRKRQPFLVAFFLVQTPHHSRETYEKLGRQSASTTADQVEEDVVEFVVDVGHKMHKVHIHIAVRLAKLVVRF